MGKIKEKDFIAEIIHCLKEQDIIKSKALIQFFPDIGGKTQVRVLFEINKATDEIAFPILDYLYGIQNIKKCPFISLVKNQPDK